MAKASEGKIQLYKKALDERKTSIEKLLPNDMSVERFNRVALRALNASPVILQCDPNSVIASLLLAAELGLEPSGALGEAYLVPYGSQCNLIIGYQGLRNLALRTGDVDTIEAHCVYEGDKFAVIQGTNPSIKHVPALDGERVDDKIIAVYAIAWLKNGKRLFDWMSKQEVDKIRNISKAKDAFMWTAFYGEGCRKTAVRRLAKQLRKSVHMAKAMELDNRAETGKPIIDLIDLDVEELGDILPPVEEPQATGDGILNKLTDKKRGRPKKEDKTPEEIAELEKVRMIKDIMQGVTMLPEGRWDTIREEHNIPDSLQELDMARLNEIFKIVSAEVDKKDDLNLETQKGGE